MMLVLSDFGFGTLGLTVDDFLKENYVTQLGYPPLRIDILNSITGVSFDEALEHSLKTKIDDLNIIYIGMSELITNKMATGRKQDIADVESLQKLKKQN
jgi:predicted nucleotidyltransferase